MDITRSINLFWEAQKHIPGGVNSPARAFKSVETDPIFFDKAKGSILTDVDGNEYIDYVGSWGPMILGHAYDTVINAIKEAAEKTTSFGAPTELEIKLAQLVKEMVPNIDKVRMVNSGTEACMSAVRLARGYTGRDKIIKFKGNYHGHADSFLIDAGSGALTLGTPSSPGVTKGTAADTLTANFNDIENVRKLVEKSNGQVAAIILEPVAGNMGVVPPKDNFLQKLRELCDEHDIVLIFDEVMTGFRISKGGAQEKYNVKADLVTFGKVIGGGLPVGAFAGREEIMSHISPEGPVYQAGTLSGNPLAMAAGYAQLKELNDNPNIYDELEEKAQYLHSYLDKILEEKQIDFTINRVGSMISIFFTDKEVYDFETANTTDKVLYKNFFQKMLEQGIYLPPSPFESWFLANTLSRENLDNTIDAFKKSL